VIVDLSNNTGGDMNPIILGISSLLPNGKLFSSVDNTNETLNVSLKNDSISSNESLKVNKTSKLNKIPVAVIMNKITASSGEITALSFKGLSNVKFFGEKSTGYTSMNMVYNLYNGTELLLTTAKIRDRTGKLYFNNKINPDEYTHQPKASATEWISSQTK